MSKIPLTERAAGWPTDLLAISPVEAGDRLRCGSGRWLILKALLWIHVHATQGPRRRFDAFVNQDQSQPLLYVASKQGYNFLGGARWALAVDARRVRKDVRGP